ncbi:MAG: DUF4279 domain-containing protein [Bacteroidales bacterium]|nr:DUF4279 domain-containing protein [Bacteroidales bacterium]MCF8457677.1 DUF4279 domain-containing protein [Bacteroidales bacterium]
MKKKDYRKIMGTDSIPKINQNHVILRFIDFDFDPNDITKKLGLKPLSIARQGEEYFVGHKRIRKIWEFNHWDYELKTNTNDFIGDTVDQFFNEIISPRLDEIKEISQKSKTTRLIIVQYYYSGPNPGYGFEKEQVKILAEINAEIDMDIYCLGDDKDDK